MLSKLNDYGWSESDVLANFIVVMVANDKSKDDITAELNDSKERGLLRAYSQEDGHPVSNGSNHAC